MLFLLFGREEEAKLVVWALPLIPPFWLDIPPVRILEKREIVDISLDSYFPH